MGDAAAPLDSDWLRANPLPQPDPGTDKNARGRVIDLRVESERAAADRGTAVDGLRRAHEAIEASRMARSARESERSPTRLGDT